MIEKLYGGYVLYCDYCGEDADGTFHETFQDAVEVKKELKWKGIKEKDGWKDACPKCQEGET